MVKQGLGREEGMMIDENVREGTFWDDEDVCGGGYRSICICLSKLTNQCA